MDRMNRDRDDLQDDDASEMSVSEAGQKGGEETKRRHGPEFYSEIGQRGGEARAEEEGSEGMSELGKMGGEARAEQLEDEEDQ